MLNLKGVAWVGLYAADATALTGYYRDAIGLPLVEQGPHYALFDVGADTLFEIWAKGTAVDGKKNRISNRC